MSGFRTSFTHFRTSVNTCTEMRSIGSCDSFLAYFAFSHTSTLSIPSRIVSVLLTEVNIIYNLSQINFQLNGARNNRVISASVCGASKYRISSANTRSNLIIIRLGVTIAIKLWRTRQKRSPKPHGISLPLMGYHVDVDGGRAHKTAGE